MRQIILDTETTGLDPAMGHRIIEVAAVEVINRKITDRHFQRYVNPEREIDEGAKKVHGITELFLSDKPKFRDVLEDFLSFISGAELIIHNAPFDLSFLNQELQFCKRENIDSYINGVLDSLVMARELHPGKRNSLDALCDRYKIDNSKRSLHGALLDSRLLAECYLAMTRGQESLLISEVDNTAETDLSNAIERKPNLFVKRAERDELALHERYLEDLSGEIKENCLWLKKNK
ncbi:MAG: DNA polymerase III subunit epsilon [Alphaproteobacteria bacterium TMED93]|nr:MAG: DNA polymerase III subunit epsilon [Alphaproteobacteria bacterium TMED93]